MSHILRCVPEGHRPTSNALVWRQAVRGALTDQRRRTDFRESVERCLRVYINAQNVSQGFTTSPSWKDEDLEEYGITRTTWARVWRWLIDSKLLGWVAWGRQHSYKPDNLKALKGEEGDDKAVYVLAVPLTDVDLEDESPAAPTSPVDISGTLPPEGESFSSNPQRAHTYTTEKDDAPHRRKSTWRGFAALSHRLLPALPELPKGDMTAKSSKNKALRVGSQLEFARTLKHFVPALDTNKISDKSLASVLRQQGFFDAGWTVNDIRFAVDRRPDGTAWNHDGATGVGNLAKWLAYRLEPWRDEHGWPLQSQDQRQRTEQAEAKARRQKAAERIAAQEVARQNGLVSGTFAKGIAMLRAIVNKQHMVTDEGVGA